MCSTSVKNDWFPSDWDDATGIEVWPATVVALGSQPGKF